MLLTKTENIITINSMCFKKRKYVQHSSANQNTTFLRQSKYTIPPPIKIQHHNYAAPPAKPPSQSQRYALPDSEHRPQIGFFLQVAIIRAEPLLKGPFLKEKITFWKNRLCSKSVTSLAKDESFFIGSSADKIPLLKVVK